MEARDWVLRYAEQLGVPAPSEPEIEVILELAGVAAHASERTAAPVACYIAAAAGLTPAAALRAAREVSTET